MKIEYDREADAMYITLREEATLGDTVEVTDTLNVDLDREGRPVGIELLFVREWIPGEELARVTVENLLAEVPSG